MMTRLGNSEWGWAEGCLSAVLLACAVCWLPGCGGQNGRQGGSADATSTAGLRQFAIEGMVCDGCVGTVTGAIEAVPGVTSVKVSLEEKTATVAADAEQVPDSAIEQAVTEAGYKAQRISSAEGPQSSN